MARTVRAGGSRKLGRSMEKCKRYRTQGRREENKRRRLERKLRKLKKRHPDVFYEIRKFNIVKTGRKAAAK